MHSSFSNPQTSTAKLPSPILVVEDDPFVREVVMAALAGAGITAVKACASGAEALAMVADVRPALVLLDFMMPGMDGIATWSALRERLTAAGVPLPRVVFLTARHEPGAFEGIPDVAGVLAKPFNPATLADDLAARLGGAGTDAPTSSSARLKAVASAFSRALPSTADEIERLGFVLDTTGWQRTIAEAVLAKAHSLAGSAGLFARHGLGTAASDVEGLLLNYLRLDRVPDPRQMQTLHRAVAALLAACRSG